MSVTVGAVVAGVGYVYDGEFLADMVNMFAPGLKERVSEGGENVVSKGLDVVISGMDAVGDAVAGVRDGAGSVAHDVASKVPVIGGLLGGLVDGAGAVVDVGGGIYSEAMHLLGAAQDISNVVGAGAFGAKYVESEAEASRGLTDEELDSMGATEIIRSEGLVSGTFSVASKGVFGLVDRLTGKGGEGEDMSAWERSLAQARESGKISDDKASGISFAYENGIVSDEVLDDYAASVEAGECEWDLLGTNLCSLVGDLSARGVPLGTTEEALASMESAAAASAAGASSPEPRPFSMFGPQFDSNGLVIG